MNLNDLIYSFKIENTNNKLSANLVFKSDDISFKINAKELLEKVQVVYEKFKGKSEINLIIKKDFVLEIKRPQESVMYYEDEEIWYIYLNDQLIDNNPWYATQYLTYNQVSNILNKFIAILLSFTKKYDIKYTKYKMIKFFLNLNLIFIQFRLLKTKLVDFCTILTHIKQGL